MSTHRNLSLVLPRSELLIEVIATGNELLDGTTNDSNTQRLALALKSFGLKIHRTTVVNDSPKDIARVIGEAILRSDVVVISGGLGPTTDDLTLATAANAFGVKMIESHEAKKNVLDRLKKARRKSNPGNMKQAWIPEGSKVLRNVEGTAPGIEWKVGDRTLFFLPGVPREFQHLLNKDLIPFFKKYKTPIGKHLITLKIIGHPESEINEWVKKLKLPEGVEVGFRTHLPENHIKFDVLAASEAEARRRLNPIVLKCRKHFGSSLFSETGQSYAENFLQHLLKKKKKMALAESCTGGLASSLVTAVSGSSAIFTHGFVVYANEAKQSLLGVTEKTLQKFGAVSEECAREMAEGALKKSGADIAAAITGIAGPTGGTKQKPVGTVCFAWAQKGKKTISTNRLFPFDRELNQKSSAYYALERIRELA